MENIERLRELIEKSNNIVFFGGAGVSTESGVKDYRSEDGLYNTVKEYGIPPERILSHTYLFEHPEVFYDFYYKYFLQYQVEPNKAHFALAELEKRGKLSAVITQNIDCLHQAAGSKRVYELHGTVSRHFCVECREEMSLEEIKGLKGSVPVCKSCGGFVRPDVVMYEEPLNRRTVMGAIGAISEADLLIIGGTSLAVYPAASYLQYFGGENIVLINKSETPFDDKATLVFRDKIGEVLHNAVFC